MISDSQRTIIVTFLVRRLPISPSVQEIENWLSGVTLAEIESFARPIEIAEWIVDRALASPTPAQFTTIVDRLAVSNSGDLAALVALADDLRQARVAWVARVPQQILDWAVDADPLMTLGSLPFVDRTEFRKLLPRVTRPDTPPCIVVSGAPLSGKTYLADFCHAFAAARQGLRVGYAGQTGHPLRARARMLARQLSVGLRTAQLKIPPQHEEDERDARNLAEWIARHTPEAELPALAIIDGFDHPDIPEAVHVFICELARRVATNEEVRKRLRLVLTPYDASRLIASGVTPELHVLEAIGEPDLVDWFRKRFPDQPQYQYDAAAEAIMRKFQAYPDEQRMSNFTMDVHEAMAVFA